MIIHEKITYKLNVFLNNRKKSFLTIFLTNLQEKSHVI